MSVFAYTHVYFGTRKLYACHTRVYGLELSIITVHVPKFQRIYVYDIMTSQLCTVEVISFSIMLHYKMTSTLLRKNKNSVNVSVKG